MIILMAGLPGTGKSRLACELASRTAGRVLSKDTIRHAIFTPDEIEYSTQQDDFCQQVMMQMAGYFLLRDPRSFIFLDGRPFSRRYQIENAIAAADALRQPWKIVECVCSEETAKRRLNEDMSEGGHPAGNRDFELYLAVKRRFETILLPKVVLHTEQPLEACLGRALAAIRE